MNDIHPINEIVIQKLQKIVIANLQNENFGVKELSSASGMSRSTIHRKLKAYLNKSVSQFIREIRLERAMELLQLNNETASEISYKVGFRSPTYFNSCFHHHFGFPPGEVKKMEHPLNHESKNSSGFSDFLNRHKIITIAILFVTPVVLVVLSFFIFALLPENNYSLKSTWFKDKNKSIAVLPFKSLCNNPDNQYFADGIMEDILNNLCKIQKLKVISRASVERFRESKLSAKEIAKNLKVEFILEGSVQRDSDKVKIAIQLIDARHDRHVWSEKFEKQLFDIFAVQSSIAQNIATELQAVLSHQEIKKIERIPTKNADAYNSYLKGRFFWNRRTPESLEKSKKYFEEALRADPGYANAYAGMADNYFVQAWGGWTDRNSGFAMAKKYVQQALKIDQNLSDAHATLGGILCWSEWNWAEAEKEFITAIELNPQYSTAYQYYSELLDILGAEEDAVKLINVALEFDPFSRVMNDLKSLYFYNQGRYEESLQNCDNLMEFAPDFTNNYWQQFYIYLKQGKDMEALESLQKIVMLDTMTLDSYESVKEIYLNLGIKGIFKRLIDHEITRVNPRCIFIAKWYILLENKEESLKWLEKALVIKSPSIPRVNTDPDFKCLGNNPRYKKLIREMGLK